MNGSTYQIKSIKGMHNCAHVVENRQANYKYIGRRMLDIVRDNPDERLGSLKKKIRRDMDVECTLFKMYKAKRYALELLRGSSMVVHLDRTLTPPLFQRMYFCLNGSREGFSDVCRPIISLDGCFLKDMFKGQLLAAIGRDGNDNMYPIVVAFVEVEKFETWEWFLNMVLRDIGSHDDKGWAFISDRQKGLVQALHKLAPNAEHRFCLRHMYNNFKAKFSGQELKRLFWKVASTYNVNHHMRVMREIERVHSKRGQAQTPFEWLNVVTVVHWARCFFTTRTKCDVIVNNIIESFNSYILDAMDKPIIEMFEWIKLVGYPCCHAIAAYDYHRLELDDYVDDCLKKDTYLRVYRHMINPVPRIHDFEVSSLGKIDPPQVKVRSERPTKRRRRDGNDKNRNPIVVSRKGLTYTCAICHEMGHNRQRCPLGQPSEANIDQQHAYEHADEQPNVSEMPPCLHRVPKVMLIPHTLRCPHSLKYHSNLSHKLKNHHSLPHMLTNLLHMRSHQSIIKEVLKNLLSQQFSLRSPPNLQLILQEGKNNRSLCPCLAKLQRMKQHLKPTPNLACKRPYCTVSKSNVHSKLKQVVHTYKPRNTPVADATSMHGTTAVVSSMQKSTSSMQKSATTVPGSSRHKEQTEGVKK
ncbi:hypothetical protein BUALT_Bualt13G0124900 [Buddleja alternifolia]|uniref:MULE transposase domain-containing protein n=1 Tax=Buddleja alternifolia TaxID=168488 RepID=A0AAV6WUK4_9LAMI|nr:hypothetical protein BUALT_Bualt13G0124900 [Buddleja alternifolia]